MLMRNFTTFAHFNSRQSTSHSASHHVNHDSGKSQITLFSYFNILFVCFDSVLTTGEFTKLIAQKQSATLFVCSLWPKLCLSGAESQSCGRMLRKREEQNDLCVCFLCVVAPDPNAAVPHTLRLCAIKPNQWAWPLRWHAWQTLYFHVKT